MTQSPFNTSTYTCISNSNHTTGLDQGLFVYASVAGGNTITFQVDTGSAGIVIDSSNVDPSYTSYPCFGPGTMNYYPSQNSPSGVWYLLPVELMTGTGANAGTGISGWAMVLVCQNYKSDFGMMGVAGKGQNPLYNLFFNLQNKTGPLAPAYAIQLKRSGSAYVGTLTFGATYDYFSQTFGNSGSIALQPTTPPPLPPLQGIGGLSYTQGTVTALPAATGTSTVQSWASPNVWLTLNRDKLFGTKASIVASLELDTGIDTMLIAVGSALYDHIADLTDTVTGQNYPVFNKGVGVSVSTPLNGSKPDTDGSLFQLEFDTSAVGAGEAPDPATVFLMPAVTNILPDTTRVNIGRNPLWKYIYGYDAQNGFMSFALAQ
jgi:hypothetical protein